MDKINSQGEKYEYMVHNRCGFAAGGEYCRVCPVRGGQTGGQAEKQARARENADYMSAAFRRGGRVPGDAHFFAQDKKA